jgi:hypothetical protein
MGSSGIPVFATPWTCSIRKVNDTESLVVPGHDVVALFAKDNKCAISFSGTHGLADWSTNFNAMLGRSGTISVEVALCAL